MKSGVGAKKSFVDFAFVEFRLMKKKQSSYKCAQVRLMFLYQCYVGILGKGGQKEIRSGQGGI